MVQSNLFNTDTKGTGKCPYYVGAHVTEVEVV